MYLFSELSYAGFGLSVLVPTIIMACVAVTDLPSTVSWPFRESIIGSGTVAEKAQRTAS